MRHRILRAWLVALMGALLLGSASPLVFSVLTVGSGALPAAAFQSDEPAAKAEPAPAEQEPAAKAAPAPAEKEPAAKAEPAPAEKEPAAKAPADKEPAKDAGEKPGVEKIPPAKSAADKPREASGTPSAKDNFLVWLYHSLRVRYVVIFLIITFNAVALIVMIVLGARRNSVCPDELVLEFETKLNEKQYQEAYELLKGDKTFLGKVLMAGMSKLSDGYAQALEAMQEVGEEQNMKIEQRNGYIALIAQVAPMFGLLGTVDGMVMAFDVIAHSNVTPKPSELAQGIGTALVTTLVGLWIAIPMLVFYSIIRNRMSRLILEAGMIAGDLMKRFKTVQPVIKKTSGVEPGESGPKAEARKS